MDIQVEKLGLIEWIAKLEDLSIIEKIREIRDEYIKTSDWYDEISEADKVSIQRGLQDAIEGKVHSHKTVKKLYDKYL